MTEQATAPGERVEQRSTIWRWWKSLDEDRAGRAELRQCGDVAEVAFTAPYHTLLRWLGSRLGEADAARVAAAAAVLAHIEREPADTSSLARQMGTPKGEGQGAIVNDSRFRHMLRQERPEELMRELIRVVRQLDRVAAVEPLFRDLMDWTERTRTRWAREYYEAAPIAKREK